MMIYKVNRKYILKLLTDLTDAENRQVANKILKGLIDSCLKTEDNVYYFKIIHNPELLEFSKQKRYMWHSEEGIITYILKYGRYTPNAYSYKSYDDFK